ncbi:hypothetical protein IJ090_00110 [Candidatus Saccharibacteria bacterium]|nr:hypothetical protein [Candidatus Saccharibacteria bacterium]
MPRYQTYGQYDEKNDVFPDSAEKVLRANEEMASDWDSDWSSARDDDLSVKGDPRKEGFYQKNEDWDADWEKSNYDWSTAREANEREGLYRGDRLASALKGARGKSKGGSFLKRRAPLVAIILLISGMGIGIGMSQVLMPFHVVESLTEMTDGSFTARAARMPRLIKWMFNMEGDTAYTQEMKGAFGGTTTTRYRKSITSDKMKSRLAAEGIEVDTSGENTVLRYKDAGGADVEVKAEDYTAKYYEDAEFRNKMNRGGRSFLGRIAAHIDLTLANFLNSHNLTKNLFEGWINKVYDVEGQTIRLHDAIETRNLGTDVKTEAGDYDGSSERPVDIDADADTNTENLKTNYKDMISNIASITTSTVCGAAAVASAVTVAKVAIAYQNARGAFSGVAEAVDKTKAGDGNNSPINASADLMMKRDSNGQTMLQSESMKWALSGGTYTPNKNAEDVKSTSIDSIFRESLISEAATSTGFIIGCAVAKVTTAAVSMVIDIVGNIVTAGAFSVGKLALTTIIGTTTGIVASVAVDKLANMLVNNATTNFCLDASGPEAGACMYLGATKYNGQNFQAGGGSLATKTKAEGFYDEYRVALEEEAELIRSTKSPFDTSSSHTFLGSIVSKLGLIAVEMPSLSSVASMFTNVAASSFASLMPAASAVDKFSYFSNQLRDDCANLQFGNIQALGDLNCEPVLITDQSLNSGTIGGLAEVEGEAATRGASGVDPEYVFKILKDAGSFETKTDSNGNLVLEKQDANGNKTDSADGVEIIKPDSLLGKYISYCGYRNSPFGHIDQNIMNAESQATSSTVLGSILNAIPILGDLLDMAEGIKQMATVGWSSGVNCVARETGQDSTMEVATFNDNEVESGTVSVGIESWNNFMRYAQSYVADDRFMQTSYEGYISPVQLFAEQQGLVASDNELSLVEYLAKYSGYTVENMQLALNEVEYWTYIAQYDSEGKGPTKFEEASSTIDNFSVPDGEVYADYNERIAAVPQYIIYADLRNREVAMA